MIQFLYCLRFKHRVGRAWINHLMNDDSVWRGAPGFVQVCLTLELYEAIFHADCSGLILSFQRGFHKEKWNKQETVNRPAEGTPILCGWIPTACRGTPTVWAVGLQWHARTLTDCGWTPFPSKGATFQFTVHINGATPHWIGVCLNISNLDRIFLFKKKIYERGD